METILSPLCGLIRNHERVASEKNVDLAHGIRLERRTCARTNLDRHGVCRIVIIPASLRSTHGRIGDVINRRFAPRPGVLDVHLGFVECFTRWRWRNFPRAIKGFALDDRLGQCRENGRKTIAIAAAKIARGAALLCDERVVHVASVGTCEKHATTARAKYAEEFPLIKPAGVEGIDIGNKRPRGIVRRIGRIVVRNDGKILDGILSERTLVRRIVINELVQRIVAPNARFNVLVFRRIGTTWARSSGQWRTNAKTRVRIQHTSAIRIAWFGNQNNVHIDACVENGLRELIHVVARGFKLANHAVGCINGPDDIDRKNLVFSRLRDRCASTPHAESACTRPRRARHEGDIPFPAEST